MKILFVCHDPPSPANNGGTIDMLGMARALVELGHELHLLYTYGEVETCRHLLISESKTKHILGIARNKGMRAAISVLPYQIASRRALMDVKLTELYDVVIATDHCAGIFQNSSLKTRRRVLRRQNNEALYAQRMRTQSSDPTTKLFFWKEEQCFRYWSYTDALADQIWYISTEELMQAKLLEAQSKAVAKKPKRLLVPGAMVSQVSVLPDIKTVSNRHVLYFGSLTVPINRHSVDWYLNYVHPQVKARVPDYRLTVAGRTADTKWARDHQMAHKFRFWPNPENADDVYLLGGVFIDPKAHDVGVKMKILEAIRRGFPVVCSPASLFGSGLVENENVLTASTAKQFADAVTDLLENPHKAVSLAVSAQNKLIEHFDIKRDIRNALGRLES